MYGGQFTADNLFSLLSGGQSPFASTPASSPTSTSPGSNMGPPQPGTKPVGLHPGQGPQLNTGMGSPLPASGTPGSGSFPMSWGNPSMGVPYNRFSAGMPHPAISGLQAFMQQFQQAQNPSQQGSGQPQNNSLGSNINTFIRSMNRRSPPRAPGAVFDQATGQTTYKQV